MTGIFDGSKLVHIINVLYHPTYYICWYMKMRGRYPVNDSQKSEMIHSILGTIQTENPILQLKCNLEIDKSWKIEIFLFSHKESGINLDLLDLTQTEIISDLLSEHRFATVAKRITSNYSKYENMIYDHLLGQMWKRSNALKAAIDGLKKCFDSDDKKILIECIQRYIK